MGFFSDMSEESFEDEQSKETKKKKVAYDEADTYGEIEGDEDYLELPGEDYAPEPDEVMVDDDEDGGLIYGGDEGAVRQGGANCENAVGSAHKGSEATLDTSYCSSPKESCEEIGGASYNRSSNYTELHETVVESSTTVCGRMTSKGRIVVMGTVEGGIEAESVWVVGCGDVRDDVVASEIVFDGGSVGGQIVGKVVSVISGKVESALQAEVSLSIEEGAIVVGSIASGNANISGKVKGNISSTGVVVLEPTAVVKGDISGADVRMEAGAKFQGSITKTGEIDDSEFEQ